MERRELIKEAASLAVAMRPAGISSERAASSSWERCPFIEVSIAPKAMAFTEMLLGASSLARAFVKLLMAPFVAE